MYFECNAKVNCVVRWYFRHVTISNTDTATSCVRSLAHSLVFSAVYV